MYGPLSHTCLQGHARDARVRMAAEEPHRIHKPLLQHGLRTTYVSHTTIRHVICHVQHQSIRARVGWADNDTDWGGRAELAASLDGRKNIPLPYCSTPCMAGRAPPPPADTPAPAACRAAAGAGPHTKRCSPIPPGRALGAGLQRGLSRLLGARESERKGPFGESKQAGLMGEPFLPHCLVSACRLNLHSSLRPRPR